MASNISASDILDFDRPIRERARKALEQRRAMEWQARQAPVLERTKQGELYEQPEPDPDALVADWLFGKGTGSFWKDLGLGVGLGGLSGPALEAAGYDSGTLDWIPGGGIGKAVILGALTRGGKNVLEGVTKEMMKEGQKRVPGYIKKGLQERFGDEALDALGGIMEKYDIRNVSMPQAVALLGKEADISQKVLRNLNAEKEMDDLLHDYREYGGLISQKVVDRYVGDLNDAIAESDPFKWQKTMSKLASLIDGKESAEHIEAAYGRLSDADYIDVLVRKNTNQIPKLEADIRGMERELEQDPSKRYLKSELARLNDVLENKKNVIQNLTDMRMIINRPDIDQILRLDRPMAEQIVTATASTANAEKEARIGKLMESIAKSRSKDLSKMGKQQRKQFDADLNKRVNELNKLEKELGREPTKFDKLGRPVRVEKPAPAPTVKEEPVQAAPASPTYQVNKVSGYSSPTEAPVVRPSAPRPAVQAAVDEQAPLVFKSPAEEVLRPVPKELQVSAPAVTVKKLNLENPKTVEEVLAAGWVPEAHPMPTEIKIGQKKYPKSDPTAYDRYTTNEMGDEAKRNLYYGDSLATHVLSSLFVKDAFKDADFKKLFGESKKGRHNPNMVNYNEMMNRFNKEINSAVDEARMTNVSIEPKMVSRDGRIEPKRDAAGNIIYTPVLDLNGGRTVRKLWQYAPYQGNDINPTKVDLYDLFLRRYIDDVLEAENPTYRRPAH